MSYHGPPSRGILGHRSVAFWTVVAGIVAVVTLIVTLARPSSSSGSGASPPATSSGSFTSPSASPSTDSTGTAPSPTKAAITTYLSDLPPADGLPATDPVQANGTTYAHTIDTYAECDDPSATKNVDYVLGRKYRTLHGYVALRDDNTRTVTIYQVQLVGDGRILYTHRVPYGKTYKIDVGIKGILRLSLRVTLLTGSGAECYFQGDVVFGDLYAQS